MAHQHELRICHVARDIALSGGGEVVKQVAKNTARTGIPVVVITDTPDVDLGPGVVIRKTPFGGRLLNWCPSGRLGWTLRHALMIFVFTVTSSYIAANYRVRGWVVFNHNCESLVGQILVMHNVFSAELVERNLGTLGTIRAMMNPVRAMRICKELILSRGLFNRRLVAVSEAAKAQVVRLAGEEDRVSVIANGVDIHRFSKVDLLSNPLEGEEWRRVNGIEYVVLFVGHEWKRKGLDELIEAMTLLPDNFGLMVVGGRTQDLTAYSMRTDVLGVSKRVYFAGEQSAIESFYALADVFCLPSHYETMPLVALEALAAGRPVVLSQECPAIDYIVPGLNGAVSSHKPTDIAACIAEVLVYGAKPGNRREIRRSVQHLGWDVAANAYVAAAYNVYSNAELHEVSSPVDE